MLAGLRSDLRAWLVSVRTPRDALEEIVLAASEAVANAIEHAAPPVHRMVEVEASLADEEVVVAVQDFGTWREPMEDSDRGRGFVLMRALMDDVAVEAAPLGTRVTMRRRLTQPVRV